MDNMEQGATSKRAKVRTASTRKNLTWSKDEENALIHGLKELIARCYKCDNGFKSGSTLLLEEMLRNEVKGTNITAKPHIDSKLKVWKKLYNSLKLMLGPNGSGVGVLNSEYKIDATEEKWDAQIKKDPGAHALRNKSFPFYDDWKDIFGNDYAVRDNAQTCPDVVEDEQSEPHTQTPFNFEHVPATPPFTDTFTPDTQTSNRPEESSATRSSGKKRKTPMSDPYIGQLGEFFDRTDLSINTMTTKLVDQMNVGYSKRERLFEILQGYEFMSPVDILKVTDHMAENPHQLDIWWSFNDHFKVAKVKQILELP